MRGAGRGIRRQPEWLGVEVGDVLRRIGDIGLAEQPSLRGGLDVA